MKEKRKKIKTCDEKTNNRKLSLDIKEISRERIIEFSLQVVVIFVISLL